MINYIKNKGYYEFKLIHTAGVDFYFCSKLKIVSEVRDTFAIAKFVLSNKQQIILKLSNTSIRIDHVSDIFPINLDGLKKVVIAPLRHVDDSIKCIRVTSLSLTHQWYIDIDLSYFTKRLYSPSVSYGVEGMYNGNGIAYIPKDANLISTHPIQKYSFLPSVIDNRERLIDEILADFPKTDFGRKVAYTKE